MEIRPEIDTWLASARAGDPAALGQALEAFRAYLTLVAEREMDPLLRAKGGASDLVQETFMEAQRAFPRFQTGAQEEFLAWLRTLLLNNLADFRRRYRGTEKRAADREVALEAGSSSRDWRGNLMAAMATPSGEFVERETMDQIQRALERLPEDYRQVVTYRYIEDRSFEEIAQLMNRSANATRKLFARAIERLQQEMESAP
ncbi:MAG: sigma-70 family RNA polymerase sigma factor [Pirellulaceae bacterium]